MMLERPNICPTDGTTLQTVRSYLGPLFLCSRCLTYWKGNGLKVVDYELDRYLTYVPELDKVGEE